MPRGASSGDDVVVHELLPLEDPERGKRAQIPTFQLLDLRRPDVGNQRQMVVAPPVLIAVGTPPADVAVGCRVWIGCRLFALGDATLHLPAQQTVVGRIIRAPERVGREGNTRRDNMDPFRREALQFVQHRGIGAQLQNRRAARFSRELRVDRFIRPMPQRSLAPLSARYSSYP